MFNHITVGSNDLQASKTFYDAVLPALGWRCANADPEAGWITYSKPDPEFDIEFLVCRPINGEPATSANGVTVGLRAGSSADVESFHENALRSGGTCAGPPGPRADYHSGFYGTYVRDPAGNKICCLCNT